MKPIARAVSARRDLAVSMRPACGRVLASVHTGGKALGVLGAYVCGSGAVRELLINRCRHLIFTTALPLAVAPWWLAALARLRQDDEGRQLLHANAAFFRQQLAGLGLPAGGADYIVPLILGDDGLAVQMAERVQRAGFDVRAIRPPTVVPGTARLRISLHADHDRPTLLALANALRHDEKTACQRLRTGRASDSITPAARRVR